MYDLKWLKQKGFFEHEITDTIKKKTVYIDTVNFIAFVEHDNKPKEFNEQINQILKNIKEQYPKIKLVYFYHKDRIKIYSKYTEIKWFYYTPSISKKATKTGKENKLNEFSPENINVLFDTKEIVKKFYKEISSFREKMAKSIKNINEEKNKYLVVENYFHRLIFFYFISQLGLIDISSDETEKITLNRDSTKKQFLENTICKNLKDDEVHLFFSTLFFEVFGTPSKHENKNYHKYPAKVGKLKFNIHAPYLNGGLFEEKEYEGIKERDIVIKHSKKLILEVFNQYNWIVGEEIPDEEEEIQSIGELTPDVLGYVFEQYINQKQMGAYYTKEDITGYISRNTIIPFIYDKLKKEKYFTKEREQKYFLSLVWKTPAEYIYPAVKKGVEYKLPDYIEKGINDVSKRERWNEQADEKYALPTEIWREVVERRKRYKDIVEKAKNRKINSINDFITYNLDIEGFIKDALSKCDDLKIIKSVYNIINEVTILDPTVGSGAFLFAALNILYTIYEICVNKLVVNKDEKVLEAMKNHGNKKYFITKSIILNNLFGVDIMLDAVEICKLRLFLRLIADVEDRESLEPLPDIDFNIRYGNSLVGFIKQEEIEKATEFDLLKGTYKIINEEAEKLSMLFNRFRDEQTTADIGKTSLRESKNNIIEIRNNLNKKLNKHLATIYGIDVKKKEEYEGWLKTHQPFHWFFEFYRIVVLNNGFDIIIGNPPYVSKRKINYSVFQLETMKCPDIYSWILERNTKILNFNGKTGMILPLSLSFSNQFSIVRNIIFKEYGENWFSSFGRIPSALFNFDVRVRNVIHIGHKNNKNSNHTTQLHRWFEEERSVLFKKLNFTNFNPSIWDNIIPKICNYSIKVFFENILSNITKNIDFMLINSANANILHFKKSAYNWLSFSKNMPPCYNEKGKRIPQTKVGTVYFNTLNNRNLAFLLLNGKIMFLFWCIIGDDFDVTKWNFANFPINFDDISNEDNSKLEKLSKKLDNKMQKSISFKVNAGKKVGNFNLSMCRDITDKSDKIFLKYLCQDDKENIWEKLQLFYTQMVRTNYDYDD